MRLNDSKCSLLRAAAALVARRAQVFGERIGRNVTSHTIPCRHCRRNRGGCLYPPALPSSPSNIFRQRLRLGSFRANASGSGVGIVKDDRHKKDGDKNPEDDSIAVVNKNDNEGGGSGRKTDRGSGGLDPLGSLSMGYRSIGSFHSDNVDMLNSLPPSEYGVPALPFPDDDDDDGGDEDAWMLDRKAWTFLNHGAFGASLKRGHVRACKWRTYLESQPLRYFDRVLLPHLVESNRRTAAFVNGDPRRMIPAVNATSALNSVIGGYARAFGRDGGGRRRRREIVSQPYLPSSSLSSSSSSSLSLSSSVAIYFDLAYGSVKKMAKHYCDHVVEIPFQESYLPLTTAEYASPDDAFLEAFEAALARFKCSSSSLSLSSSPSSSPPRLEGALLILDETTSNTSLNVPVGRLASRAKEEGMIVLVDGAHGLLAQDVDVAKLSNDGVDFYVSNCHKWLSSPRGAAMLYVCGGRGVGRRRVDEDHVDDDADHDDEDFAFLRDEILRQPAIVSHGIDDGFLSRFIWDGCRDYASQLSLPVVYDHWERLGQEKVRHQMRSGLRRAVRILASLWHNLGDDTSEEDIDDYNAAAKASSLVWGGVGEGKIVGFGGGGGGGGGPLTIAPLSMHSSMALVRLPDRLSGNGNGGTAHLKTSADAKAMQDFLHGLNIEVPVKCVGGVLYVRISCHVYNVPEEYDRLGRAVLAYPG